MAAGISGWGRTLKGGGVLGLLFVGSAAAQAPPGAAAWETATVDAARLYAVACAPCHGRRGDGRGRVAGQLGQPAPRDFTAGVFKFRSTPSGAPPTDADLYRTISRGVPGTWMPGWEDQLTSNQRWALVRYIKRFSEVFGEPELDSPITIPREPERWDGLVQEGRFVYVVLGCAKCHGTTGRGDGPSAQDLTDDWDRAIRPYDLRAGRFRNGSRPADLYRTFLTGLDGTPMPAYELMTVVFSGGPDADLSAGRDIVAPGELEALTAYLATQPSAAALGAMSPAEVADLAAHRLWSLVAYVRSLVQPVGIFGWLFGENPEVPREDHDHEN